MKKRICSIFLLLTLLLALLPLQANAVTAGMAALDMQEISRTEYQISKDVKEYEWLLNNGSLTKQRVGHVMEVKVGKDSTATLAAGYSDYNIDDIKNNQWAMVKTTEQAQANACQVVSPILCKHRFRCKTEQNIFKAGAVETASALSTK